MAKGLKSSLTGDWKKAKAILNDKSALSVAINYAVLQEAQQAQRAIVKGIRDQAPGGKAFLPLAPITLAIRKLKGFRGTKALMQTGGLIGSIKVVPKGQGRAWVGVLRGARTKDGKEIVNIARLNELGGVIVMRVTPKMRKFLMVNLRKTKLGGTEMGRDRKGRYKRGKFIPSGTGQLRRGVIVIRIPARPFMAPVLEQIAADKTALQKRFATRIARKLGLKLGTA